MFTEEFKKKNYLDLGGKKKANVDHILVRDYIREIDIGAFQSEYGVKQRVSFNVILEVNTDNYPMHDNVDLVLSCLLYTSPSPRDATLSRMPSSA